MRRPAAFALALVWFATTPLSAQQSDLDTVLAEQEARLAVIAKVEPTVCCVFSPDGQGGGSGVLISPDGYALTNFHVSQTNPEMPVGLSDGKQYPAKLIAIDPTGDIALIRLSGRDPFPFAPLGDSDEVQVGDETLAMGNPFLLAKDYKPTITHGIVTGLHRHLPGSGNFNLVYSDCIQIDTPINPGNSGGPLFNLRGELIGINGRMTVRDRGRVNTGIGFAISVNQIKNFLPALRHGDMVRHALLDATVRQEPDGRIVFDQMFEDSPAYEAGVRIGDELVFFDGEAIDTVNRFANLIYTIPEGKPVEIGYRREGGEIRWGRCVVKGLPNAPAEEGEGGEEGADASQWKGPPEGHREWELERIRRALVACLAGAERLAKAEFEADALIGTDGDEPDGCRIEYGPGFAPRLLAIGDDTYRFEKYDVFRGETPIPAAQAEAYRRLASIGAASVFEDLATRFEKAVFVGSGWADELPCLVVEGRLASNRRERFLISERDHRLRRIEILDVAGTVEAAVEFADFRAAAGDVECLPTKIQWAGEFPLVIYFRTFRFEGETVGPVDVPDPTPSVVANPYRPLLEKVWPSVLKVYGQGHIRGIPAQGSAVMVDAEKGLALTNLTIMLETPNLYVVDAEGREWKAKVARREEAKLLALIELEPVEGRTFPPALSPATDVAVQPGDLILSIGNAEDLASGRELPTSQLGVVTAVTTLKARAGVQDFPYSGRVYLNDAKVNPGAYGGPVLDLEGRWIGINARIVESKATNTQVSYTIPMDVLLPFLPGHESAGPDPVAGDPRPVYHGIVLLDANPLRSPPAYVERVRSGSPASKAKIRPDDLILRADGVRIGSCAELEAFFAGCHPDQTVTLSVKRGEKVLSVELTLEAKPE